MNWKHLLCISLISTSCALTPKGSDISSPDKAWLAYAYSNSKTGRRYIDPKFESFFLNTLPPSSNFVRSTSVLSTQEIGNGSAVINLDSGGFKHWVAFKKIQGDWKLTLDENEILENLTKDWHRQQIKNIQFVTKDIMTKDQVRQTNEFVTSVKKLEEAFNIHIPLVNYYVASSPDEAYRIVGQSVKNAGRGRFRAVKTYDRYDHLHEYVHVIAMEIGLINPYFDEGLATAFEEGFRFNSKNDCETAMSHLSSVFPQALDGDTFNELNNKKNVNLYGIAQATMRYWLNNSGLERIKSVLRQTAQAPEDFQVILVQELGSLDTSKIGTKNELQKACQAL